MIKAFFKMSTAGLLSQIIAFISSIYLTKLYSPEEFSNYVVYISIITICQGLVTGKYELAMLSAKKEKESAALFIISNIICIFFLVIGVVFISLSSIFIETSDVIFYLITCISIIAFGLNNTFLYYFNKRYSYNIISSCKVIQSLVFAIAAIFLGYVGYLENGMIYAYMLSLFLLLILYMLLGKINFEDKAANINLLYLFAVARKNIEFLKFNASTTVLTGSLNNLPILLLSVFSYNNLMGLYGFVVKIVGAPVNFMSAAISQIHMRKVVEIVHNKESLFEYLIKSFIALLLLGQIVNITILLFSEYFITTFFDERWHGTIWIIKIMSTTILFKFSVVSISGTLSALQRNKLLGGWKLISFVAGISILPFCLMSFSAKYFMVSVAIFEIVIYLSLLILLIKASMDYDRTLKTRVK
ncbi:lipopolysaccharide biosynthesis protein [Vibrio breoganii]